MNPTHSKPKSANSPLLIGLIFAFACVAVGYWSYVRQLPSTPAVAPPAVALADEPAPPPVDNPPVAIPPVAAPVVAETPVAADPPAPVALTEVLSDPQNLERIGRVALASVGTDPSAEKVWLYAINNPALSPTARTNLIEDLNQEGLSNPQNPTADDLPIIENRIALVYREAPAAMDGGNAAAFQVAMTHLTALRARLQQK